MELLSNKNVLVVGATGGIGAEVTRLLKNSQANVFIAARNRSKLNELATANNIPADQVFAVDVTQPEQVEAAAYQIHARIPALDILINASGIGIIRPLENLTYEDFNQVIDTNLRGTFHLLKSFLPPMKEAKKGLVLNIPGVLGKTPMAGAGAYAASKYGIDGLVKSVREELKRTNVRITNLYLGGTDTPFWDHIDMKVSRDKFVVAREAARAVWFLCQQPNSGVVSEMVIQPFNHQAI
ncbi:MAG TPA: SDR family oxidoreductase [Saprospiraceae bacterium]|nr:SDR family oxidoreductase [Saprospiraceae bacterium]HMP15312.1 SDR family oxidoreductase [Saprospiraceae bacterium]